jgi:hypothetical protein
MPSSLNTRSRSELLSHLRGDQSERWRRGERVPVEQYLAQHPALAGDVEALLELVQEETAQRRQAGEQPALDDYLRRFPQHADALRRLWGRLEVTLAQARAEGATSPEGATDPPLPLPAAPAPDLPGFQLREKLGEGGMGVVYRAHDLRLDQLRAIKVIRAGAFAGGESHDRFSREAKAVARLDHPGVVRIYSLGEHHGALYIVMEFLEGGSLQARLRQDPLAPREAADLVRRLALAVQHAHDNRVLHRDLKPGNVLLSANGAPKITDFGLAKLLDSDDELTQSGAVMGTPAYMAPEQAEGRQSDIDGRTDVWALGAILYECLTGRPPFKGDSRSETLEQVRKRRPVPPRALRAEVPAGLEEVCLRCLEKRAHRRYATAAQLAADLQAWLDGRSPRVPPARRLRRLGDGLRRRWPVASLAAALLAAALVAAFLLLPRGEPPPGPPAPGVWHPLLAKEPVPLRWPAGMNNHKRFDAAAREVVLSSDELGLLALGETAAPHYQLVVKLQQSPWVGNVGLFFGYQDRPAEKGPGQSYQVVELSSAVQADQTRKWWVSWRTIDQLGAPGRQRQIDKAHGTSAPFDVSPGEHRLALTVGAGGLESVYWDDDKVLPRLKAAGANPPPAGAYRGRFGLYVSNGNGAFRDARFLFREGP